MDICDDNDIMVMVGMMMNHDILMLATTKYQFQTFHQTNLVARINDTCGFKCDQETWLSCCTLG